MKRPGWFSPLLASLVLLSLFFGSNSFYRPPWVEKLEYFFYDYRLGSLQEPLVYPKIVLITAGDLSFQRLGQWPWPRDIHAHLLANLSLARVVVVDILFPEPSDPDKDAALVSAVAALPNTVFAAHLHHAPDGPRSGELIFPFPSLREVIKQYGITNLELGVDGAVRYIKPSFQINGQLEPSMALAAALAVEGRALTTQYLDTLKTDDAGRLWINFGSLRPETYEYYQILNGEIPAETFADKVVVVGVAASGTHDYFMVPKKIGTRQMSGSELICEAIETLLTGKSPLRASSSVDALVTMAMVVLGGSLTRIRRPGHSIFSVIFFAGALYALQTYLFSSFLFWIASALPLAALLTSFTFFLFGRYTFLQRDLLVKGHSLSAITELSYGEMTENITYDEYLHLVWEDIAQSAEIDLISTEAVKEDLDLLGFSRIKNQEIIVPGKVILLENRRARPYPYLTLIGKPVSDGDENARESFILLGGLRRPKKSQIQAMAAMLLSVSWYFDLLQKSNERKQLLLETIYAIAAAVDAKDPITGNHSARVSSLTLELLDHFDLDQKTKDDIYFGALIHDIGKIGIPDAILGKKGRLTDEEYATIKTHPDVGKNIMKGVSLPTVTLQAMYEHHERYDGKGYPLKLKGEEISLAGRIIAVADVYDALTSNRPYRSPMPTEELIGFMLDKVGKDFDGQVVEALFTVKGWEHPIEAADVPSQQAGAAG